MIKKINKIIKKNNNNNLIYIAPACRMTSEACISYRAYHQVLLAGFCFSNVKSSVLLFYHDCSAYNIWIYDIVWLTSFFCNTGMTLKFIIINYGIYCLSHRVHRMFICLYVYYLCILFLLI